MAQKEQKKRDKCRRPVNFKPSLTGRTTELLSNANDKTKDNDSVKFFYLDIDEKLKIVLQNPLKRQFFYSFNTEIELDNRFSAKLSCNIFVLQLWLRILENACGAVHLVKLQAFTACNLQGNEVIRRCFTGFLITRV